MTGPTVVRNIDRASQAVLDGLGQAGVATVHESAGRTGLLSPDIRPIQAGVRIAGSAVTVLTPPGDNMMIHAAVEIVGQGDILVVATTSPSTDGMVGDLLATSLMSRGCAGLVIEAGVRDVADLRALGFPVWSRAIHAQGTVKATPGSVNIPIVCGGAAVAAGDVIVADDDGVMALPRLDASRVLGFAEERLEKERKTRERLAQGELGLDFYGLRTTLDDLGVRWVDRAEDVAD
jgi:4-hydroxy-4-methyl-2-oxoglutarate aldolase